MEPGEPAGTAAQLEIVKWHILRSDGLRAGLWTRATAALGADTLVVAGSAVMLALGTTAGPASRIAALVAMACVLVSTLYGANVLAVLKNPGNRMALPSPVPLLFSLRETAALAASYQQFHALVRGQSLDDQLEHATAELWRIGLRYSRRSQGLHRCVRWLLLSIAALMVSGVLSVLPVSHA